MKNLFSIAVLLSCLLVSSAYSFAQSGAGYHRYPHHSMDVQNAHKHFVSHLLQRQSAKLAQKKSSARTTTELAERLIAQSYYNIADSASFMYPIGIDDSARYKYSSSRSSIFNYNTMIYDNMYAINGAGIFGFGAEIGYPVHNNAPNMLCDTAWLWQVDYIDSPHVLIQYERQYSLYDTNYNVTDYTDNHNDDSTTSEYDNRYINSYDTNANISTSFALSWNFGVWDTTEYRIFTYDSHGRVIEDSTNLYSAGSWTPEEKWFYNYDDSGNILMATFYTFDGLVWQESYIYNMTYYSDNKIQTDSISTNMGMWIPLFKDTFAYTTGINYATYLREYDYGSSTGTPSYFTITKHISGIGLPDTMYTISYATLTGTLTPTPIAGNKDVFLYDSYDEPTIDIRYNLKIDTATSISWYDTSIDYINYYYYEPYEARHSNSVQNIATPSENITIYPNPATNELNIHRAGTSNGARTTIQLINASGQLVRSESLPWYSETEKISVAGLTPGIYWLTLQDNTGNSLFKQTVVIK